MSAAVGTLKGCMLSISLAMQVWVDSPWPSQIRFTICVVYFTAKWCGPCRRFTPALVDFYKKHAGSRDFMIVMVSSDREKGKMSQYMTDYKMDFPAVPFERRDSSGLKTAWGGRGIPNLVWLDGQDEVVKGSYEKGRYVGPASVLGSFKKHLAVE